MEHIKLSRPGRSATIWMVAIAKKKHLKKIKDAAVSGQLCEEFGIKTTFR